MMKLWNGKRVTALSIEENIEVSMVFAHARGINRFIEISKNLTRYRF